MTSFATQRTTLASITMEDFKDAQEVLETITTTILWASSIQISISWDLSILIILAMKATTRRERFLRPLSTLLTTRWISRSMMQTTMAK